MFLGYWQLNFGLNIRTLGNGVDNRLYAVFLLNSKTNQSWFSVAVLFNAFN